MLASLDGAAPVSLTEAFDRFVGHGPGSHCDLRFGAGPTPVAASERFAYFCAGDGGAMPVFRVPSGRRLRRAGHAARTALRGRAEPGARRAAGLHRDGRSESGPGLLPRPRARARRLTTVGERLWDGVTGPRWSASCCPGATGWTPRAGSAAPPAGRVRSRRCCTSTAGRISSSATRSTSGTRCGSTPAGRWSSSTRRGAAGTATPSPPRSAATGAASTTRTRWPRWTTRSSAAGSAPTASR